MKFNIILFFVMLSQLVSAQSVTVPSKIEFAGIKIHFNSAARKKVQYEVDKLRKSPTYFQKHVDQANLYFPLVEEVFRKKNFPLDFKYLIIQESAFNADAVSSSNAVGYWQFKEGTAKEVGMKVGEGIDERKNIYAASEGAADYITKTNQKLDNWVYALLSYNVGPGGVMSYYKPKDKGVTKMEVTSKMHWYVMKLFAHKIAFEKEVGKERMELTLFPDFGYAGKNLKQISKTSSSTLESLEKYNLWISKTKKIPSDKDYAVIFPMKRGASMPIVKEEVITPSEVDTEGVNEIPVEDLVYETPFDPRKNVKLEINHIPVITAKLDDHVGRLALKVDLPKKKFAKYNEIDITTPLVPGIPYFTKKKKSKAIIAFYTVKPGENLWMISQNYGVTMFSIRTKNRMTDLEPVVPGRVLYMRQVRPEYVPVEIKAGTKKEVLKAIDEVKEVETILEEVVKNDNDGIQEATEPKVVNNEKVIEEELVKETPVVFDPVKKEEKVVEKSTSEPVIENKAAPILYEPKKTDKNIHVVKTGETFYAISKEYGVTVDELKSANQLTDLTLSIGQELIIPNVGKQDNKELSHIVKKGDTMYSIAKKYEVKVQDLMKWNSKENTELSLGENLKIIQD